MDEDVKVLEVADPAKQVCEAGSWNHGVVGLKVLILQAEGGGADPASQGGRGQEGSGLPSPPAGSAMQMRLKYIKHLTSMTVNSRFPPHFLNMDNVFNGWWCGCHNTNFPPTYRICILAAYRLRPSGAIELIYLDKVLACALFASAIDKRHEEWIHLLKGDHEDVWLYRVMAYVTSFPSPQNSAPHNCMDKPSSAVDNLGNCSVWMAGFYLGIFIWEGGGGEW